MSSLDELLRHYGLGDYLDISTCASCSKEEGCYRCINCFGRCQLYCADCLVKTHSSLPLHQVEVSFVVGFLPCVVRLQPPSG